jgi:hypothetical protein
MSWVMVTTFGRLFDRGVVVQIWPDEIRVLCMRLSPGEEVAFLIDRDTNQAYLGTTPLDVAQAPALQRQYELALPEKPEPLVNRISHFLNLISPVKDD